MEPVTEGFGFEIYSEGPVSSSCKSLVSGIRKDWVCCNGSAFSNTGCTAAAFICELAGLGDRCVDVVVGAFDTSSSSGDEIIVFCTVKH